MTSKKKATKKTLTKKNNRTPKKKAAPNKGPVTKKTEPGWLIRRREAEQGGFRNPPKEEAMTDFTPVVIGL